MLCAFGQYCGPEEHRVPTIQHSVAVSSCPLPSSRLSGDTASNRFLGSAVLLRFSIHDRCVVAPVTSCGRPFPGTGGSGPQPHPSFIEVFGDAAFDYGPRAVAGAREDGPWALTATASWTRATGDRRTAAASCGRSAGTESGRRSRTAPQLIDIVGEAGYVDGQTEGGTSAGGWSGAEPCRGPAV
jgi:hypothetical protein